MRRRVYLAGVLCTITTGFAHFSDIYSLPIHFLVAYQKSALAAGIALLPMLGSAAIGSVIGGKLSGGRRNNNFLVTIVAAE